MILDSHLEYNLLLAMTTNSTDSDNCLAPLSPESKKEARDEKKDRFKETLATMLVKSTLLTVQAVRSEYLNAIYVDPNPAIQNSD